MMTPNADQMTGADQTIDIEPHIWSGPVVHLHMSIFSSQFTIENEKGYFCNKCSYVFESKNDWLKHCRQVKHRNQTHTQNAKYSSKKGADKINSKKG